MSLILLDLFFLILFAKGAGLLCELTSKVLKGRLLIPAVIGEIVAGIIIGNTIIEQWLDLEASSEVFEVLKELGVIFLL
ncbi:MAG TPA: hypothetical protein VLH13_00160, partial [Methanomassiliicoccales archaeon]|nr:hypothetical protein [Methanomassiliicoccales archaeon]